MLRRTFSVQIGDLLSSTIGSRLVSRSSVKRQGSRCASSARATRTPRRYGTEVSTSNSDRCAARIPKRTSALRRCGARRILAPRPTHRVDRRPARRARTPSPGGSLLAERVGVTAAGAEQRSGGHHGPCDHSRCHRCPRAEHLRHPIGPSHVGGEHDLASAIRRRCSPPMAAPMRTRHLSAGVS
jgi:hypothetical protein